MKIVLAVVIIVLILYFVTEGLPDDLIIFGDPNPYYASCSDCEGPYGSYSYNGNSYSTCNEYHGTCEENSCQTINDNCS